MRIGLDTMGGDNAPGATVEGAVRAKKEQEDSIDMVLLGDEGLIREAIQEHGGDPQAFDLQHSSEVITMGDNPTKTLRKKTDSSIVKGLDMLQKGDIHGFSGVGNTGAMLVGALYSVKGVEGVLRPSITSILPKENGDFGVILDVGSNPDCKPDVLYQFGILGSIFAEHVYGIEDPRVSLLNIGEEDKKGSLATQEAHSLMKDTGDFRFLGNIEGRDLFSDKADVVVCDGFTGNVVIKEAEAFYKMIKEKGFSDDYFDRFNYELYGGTPVLGINSNVVIGHGISNSNAIHNMIKLTKEVVEADLPSRIKKAFK